MAYSSLQIEKHIEAAKRLDKIKDRAFALIGSDSKVDEYQVHNFILSEIKKEGMITNESNCIVAFRENTSFVHYFPSQYCRKIKDDSLVMIDLWARLKEAGSPYADITWMAYKGEKLSEQEQIIFDLVLVARDEAIKFIKNKLKQGELPIGREADAAARDLIYKAEHGDKFKHTLGHSIGMRHPHGHLKGLMRKNGRSLKKNIAYTIEPGIYVDRKFGVRSEIDFYIDDNLNFVLTTKRQGEIILI
jgi:Xaa-Pro aminopeptidase